MNEPNRAHALPGERGVGPSLKGRPGTLRPADEPIDERLLTRGRLGLADAWRKHAHRDSGTHHDQRVAVEVAYEVRVQSHAETLAEQRSGTG